MQKTDFIVKNIRFVTTLFIEKRSFRKRINKFYLCKNELLQLSSLRKNNVRKQDCLKRPPYRTEGSALKIAGHLPN